ncbi:uncharacterized protein EAF01_005692 [Botrytis porri]|uniref:uncharacterized protein n=1 Tax=Botrytis porri TaxID=87229 RepID=UPI0018FFB3AC|nr:uncharacterized protein EAF01_005692 [Botrytis porri]KAF7905171.1 hypothetical protein EAF01_005692 [Botrytis porri]
MVADEEKVEANRAVTQETQDTRSTATQDVDSNKEFESLNESTSSNPVRQEIVLSEGFNTALEHAPTPMALQSLNYRKTFHASKTLTNLAVAMYLLAMSIFPLWWSAFSEIFGRRTMYLMYFAFFTLWSAIAAISTSMAMLIVMIVLGGGAATSVLAMGAGTIADIWESKERGRVMGIFFLGPMLGPLLALIIGGAVAEKWGWRST